MVMNYPHTTKKLSDKEVILGLLIEAKAAQKEIEFLKEQLIFWENRPRNSGFSHTEKDTFIATMIEYLKIEIKQEEDFLYGISSQFCPCTSFNAEIKSVFRQSS